MDLFLAPLISFKDKLSHLINNVHKTPIPAEDKTRSDAYMNIFYKIISWQDPKQSWAIFLLLNFLYILIIYYEVKFYCILFSSILLILIVDMYSEAINLEEEEEAQAISSKQIFSFVKKVYQHFLTMRSENPNKFHTAMVLFFIFLILIGDIMPGHVLIYSSFLILYFTPYFVNKMPLEYKEKMMALFDMLNRNDSISETELIPYINDVNGERDPDQDSLLTDHTQDSIPNSYMSGLNSMPSYWEADGKNDELQEADLIPINTTKQVGNYSAVEFSSDSGSDDGNMEYDSTHFNGNSSSEDDHYTEGLKFQNADRTILSITQNIGSTLKTVGENIISTVLQVASPKAEEITRQDSDSEFEIINHEDAET